MFSTDGTCGFYIFNVEANEGQIIRAELRVLQKKSTALDSHYNVDVYYLLDQNNHQSSLQFRFKHVDSTPGWKTFDITPIVLNWKKGSVNYGLQLRVTKGKKSIPCQEVFLQGEQDTMNTEPLLIVFTNDHDSNFFKHMLKKERKLLNETQNTTQQQEGKRSAVQVQNVECHRKEMIVTADSLSAGDLHVLLPKRFDAGVCEGHCTKLQLSPHTDHAHILSLHYLNTVDLSAIPSRCCVPTSYKKINMIFYNKATREHIIKYNVLAQANECNCL